MMSGSQGCIFPPVGEQGQLSLGDKAGGKKRDSPHWSPIKTATQDHRGLCRWGHMVCSGIPRNKALWQRGKKLPCSTYSLLHRNAILAKIARKSLVIHQRQIGNEVPYCTRENLYTNAPHNLSVSLKRSVGFQPVFTASQMNP